MPNQLDSGFVKADSTNLPKVSVFMVWEYIVNDARYNAPEVRGIKATLSSRENYGDSAVGYVSVKREGTICIVKGRICPEHRVRQKDYTAICKINENEEKVQCVECLDCAASDGGCKHAIAFLMWINRRHESASPTEVECYWRKSALSNVGTSKKFITTEEMTKNSKCATENFGDNSNFLNKVIEQAKAKQLDSQLSRYTFDLLKRTVYTLSIHQLMFNFCKEKDLLSVDDFIKFAKEKMFESLCKEAEERTKDQKDDILWHELRYGRITASNVYEASRCHTAEGSLVHRIIGAAKVYDNVHMERGRRLEKFVIAAIEEKLKLKIGKSGLLLIPSLPILGASPDGIGSDFILEIKCPNSEKTIKNYLLDGQISEKCKTQINVQMLAAQKKKGLFCVADTNFEKNKQFKFVWIEYDEKFTYDMIEKAMNFWKQHIFPILLKSMR